MKVSCQKENEWEGIKKRKIDEGKEGRKKQREKRRRGSSEYVVGQ
jgi:hypothetical protein